MTIGLLIAGVGTMTVVRQSLLDGTDRDLQFALATYDDLEVASLDIDSGACQLDGIPATYYLALLDANGAILCRNSPGGEESPGLPDLDGVSLAYVASTTEPFSVPSHNRESSWRVDVLPLVLDDDGRLATLAVAVGLDRVENTWRSFVIVYAGFALLAVLLGAAFTRVLADTALRQLRTVAQVAERFADGDYETRLDPGDPRTEVGSLRQSLNGMLARVETALEQRDESVTQMRQFVGDASHELRTPLVSVRGYAELYRMGAIQRPEDVASAMDRIEREAKRMGSLVEDLLTLARLDERRPLQLRPLDIVPLVDDAVNDARVSAQDRAFQMLAIDPDAQVAVDPAAAPAELFSPPPVAPPAVVLADENSMRQVLANLVGNALRYTQEGSPVELGVGVSWRRREAVVHVIDHGEGVPPALRRKIFQRFYRADKSRARDTGGSGLGLAIVQGIVAAHGGRIDVIETPGGGATFRIAIPLADDRALLELTERIRPDQTGSTDVRPQARRGEPGEQPPSS
ncbi:sensor histidine kinase [Agrococcus sp. SGAir0287]|uniref:sensor histidine kinase n=1 Tax=Agrococcus sp. SGAir0287 TaxID=2070347 RepID=UPI0010F92127|nr:HAMP domain-containing sensor histidine kinase [Agrococcus sp. SGAir0287]